MVPKQLIDRIAKRQEMGRDKLIQEGLIAYLQSQKRELLSERLELLARYNAPDSPTLKQLIKTGKAPEHPAWQDLIEIHNIEHQLKEINLDLRRLQKN